jgi:acetylornithine deacetylase
MLVMDPLALTRRLVDIDSTTGREATCGEVLLAELGTLGWRAERMAVEGDRFNVVATDPAHPRPELVFCTHFDTVPPFIPSSEDANKIYGRGSCDAKGILAAQVAAAGRLRAEGHSIGLLFTVGEEMDSAGAKAANHHAPGSRFLINGEPTENRIAIASKGSLKVDLTAEGRMAHSAYPELGDSAIDKLLDALAAIRALPLPAVPEMGPSTLNIGVIEGGRAPNVIPDRARAQLLLRLVGPAGELKQKIMAAAGSRVRVEFPFETPFQRLRTVDGIPTMVAAFTTDIPHLPAWGEPLLLGPGSIHVAHTEGEAIAKGELLEAVELYCAVARKLLQRQAISDKR